MRSCVITAVEHAERRWTSDELQTQGWGGNPRPGDVGVRQGSSNVPAEDESLDAAVAAHGGRTLAPLP